MFKISKKVLKFLKHELLEILPPTLFFFIVFSIVLFIRSLVIKEYGLAIISYSTALIGAIVVGKSILVADATPLFRWFSDKRLIYNVVWRVFLYAIITLLFQFIEELIPLIHKYRTISMAAENLFEEIHWPRFCATHIIIVSFLFVYSAATAVIGVMGKKEFLKIFFGKKHS